MPFDPFGPFRPYQENFVPEPPLTPETQQSLLGQIGSGALTGLGYVASAFGKPGRVVRGLLGGNFDELGNLIPFSDTLGITDPNREVSGAQLNQQWGLSDNANPDFLSWQGLGGLATELALDPSTYTGIGAFKGALTPLGKAAQKAGIPTGNLAGRLRGLSATSNEASALAKATGKTVAEIADKPLGGHFSLGLPFTGSEAVFDASSLVDPIAKGLGAVGDVARKIPGVAPVADALGTALDKVGLYAGAAFDRSKMGQRNRLGQEIAQKSVFPGVEAAGEAGRSALREVADILGPNTAQKDLQAISGVIEGTVTNAPPEIVQAAQVVKDRLAKAAREKIELGIADPNFAIEKYFPHAANNPEWDVGRAGFSGPGGTWKTGDPSTIQRKEILADLPKSVINDLVKDPTISTKARTLDQASAVSKVQQLTGKNFDEATRLTDFLYSLDPQRLKTGLFGNADLADYGRYIRSHEEAASTVKGLMTEMGSRAMSKEAAGPGAKNLESLMKEMGLHEGEARKRILEKMGGAQGRPLSESYLPQEVADTVLNLHSSSSRLPDLVNDAAKIHDSFLNSFKGLMTQPFLAFHMRNTAANKWMNLVVAGKDAVPGYQASAKIIKGEVAPGISQWESVKKIPGLAGKTDAEVSQALGRIAYDKGVTSSGIAKDITSAESLGQTLSSIPGFIPQDAGLAGGKNVAKYAWEMIPKSGKEANPFAARGVAGATESTFAPLKAGENLSHALEMNDRLAGWLGMIKKGYTPDEAAKVIAAAQADYKYTGFESQIVKRLIPFYGWAKSVLPFQLQEALANPGGLTGTAARIGGKAQGEGFVPQQLGSGLAVPLGGQDETGNQRWLSGLGLPFEELGNLANPVKYLAGNLSPVVKYPLERLTGRQLFTGRDTRDLYSAIGSVTGEPMPALEGAFMNSPLARVGTTLRTILDPRKTWTDVATNLGTGVKLSDINMPQSQYFQTRDYIENQLHGEPGVSPFQRFFVKPEDMQKLSPQEQQIYQLYQNLLRQRKKNP